MTDIETIVLRACRDTSVGLEIIETLKVLGVSDDDARTCVRLLLSRYWLAVDDGMRLRTTRRGAWALDNNRTVVDPEDTTEDLRVRLRAETRRADEAERIANEAMRVGLEVIEEERSMHARSLHHVMLALNADGDDEDLEFAVKCICTMREELARVSSQLDEYKRVVGEALSGRSAMYSAKVAAGFIKEFVADNENMRNGVRQLIAERDAARKELDEANDRMVAAEKQAVAEAKLSEDVDARIARAVMAEREACAVVLDAMYTESRLRDCDKNEVFSWRRTAAYQDAARAIRSRPAPAGWSPTSDVAKSEAPKKFKSALYCGHANESTNACDCDDDCACKERMCK